MAMDPVGKEDKDVDNDGKVTKADKYLMARRRAIAKRMKEEVEQIDELSKKTLGSYINKAAMDMASSRATSGKEMAKPLSKRDFNVARTSAEKYFKRKGGIEKAVNKLAKEEVDQIEEADNVQNLAVQAIQSKLKKAKVSYRDPNAKNAREEDKIARMLATKNKKK